MFAWRYANQITSGETQKDRTSSSRRYSPHGWKELSFLGTSSSELVHEHDDGWHMFFCNINSNSLRAIWIRSGGSCLGWAKNSGLAVNSSCTTSWRNFVGPGDSLETSGYTSRSDVRFDERVTVTIATEVESMADIAFMEFLYPMSTRLLWWMSMSSL